VPAVRKDIRDVGVEDLRGFDAVIHLAALSNDPIGNLDAEWTRQINFEATARLAEAGKAAGVKRFLFSSSCIMYGMSEANVVDEKSPLDPRTEYARSKVLAEDAVRTLAGDGFSPTFLRNGTIYGLSPRMRFDIVLNDLCALAWTKKLIAMVSDGSPWRPIVHVEDIIRAVYCTLEAPADAVNGEIFDALSGMEGDDQLRIDQVMIELDGAENKARLGANAALGASDAPSAPFGRFRGRRGVD